MGVDGFPARHRRWVGSVAALLAVALTVTWWVVVPSEAADASGIRASVLRYGHSSVWAILAVAALAFAVGATNRVVGRIAAVALVVYAAFVLALVT